MRDDPTSRCLCLASLGPRQAGASVRIKGSCEGWNLVFLDGHLVMASDDRSFDQVRQLKELRPSAYLEEASSPPKNRIPATGPKPRNRWWAWVSGVFKIS